MSNNPDQHGQQPYLEIGLEFQEQQQQQIVTTTIYQQYLPGAQVQMNSHSGMDPLVHPAPQNPDSQTTPSIQDPQSPLPPFHPPILQIQTQIQTHVTSQPQLQPQTPTQLLNPSPSDSPAGSAGNDDGASVSAVSMHGSPIPINNPHHSPNNRIPDPGRPTSDPRPSSKSPAQSIPLDLSPLVSPISPLSPAEVLTHYDSIWLTPTSPIPSETLVDLWNAHAQAQAQAQTQGQIIPGQPPQVLYTAQSGAEEANITQPTFADLMREISYEQSEALHEAAALRESISPTSYSHQASLNMYPSGLTSGTPATATVLPSQAQGRGRLTPMISASSQDQSQDIMFEMFPCEYCAASFSRKHDLERHRRVHSGQAPYVCEGCGAAFTRSDGRGRHWRLDPACEQAHFEKGGRGKRRSGGGPTGPSSTSN